MQPTECAFVGVILELTTIHKTIHKGLIHGRSWLIFSWQSCLVSSSLSRAGTSWNFSSGRIILTWLFSEAIGDKREALKSYPSSRKKEYIYKENHSLQRHFSLSAKMKGKTKMPESLGERDGSVGKSTCCVNLRTEVQILRAHVSPEPT